MQRRVCIFNEGGDSMEYRVKVNAFSKWKNNCLLTTLDLQPVQTSKYKLKKEKTLPLEICDEVQKEFVVSCKKYLVKHEAKQSNKFWSQRKFSSTSLH
jgi:hypothetical protein